MNSLPLLRYYEDLGPRDGPKTRRALILEDQIPVGIITAIEAGYGKELEQLAFDLTKAFDFKKKYPKASGNFTLSCDLRAMESANGTQPKS